MLLPQMYTDGSTVSMAVLFVFFFFCFSSSTGTLLLSSFQHQQNAWRSRKIWRRKKNKKNLSKKEKRGNTVVAVRCSATNVRTMPATPPRLSKGRRCNRGGALGVRRKAGNKGRIYQYSSTCMCVLLLHTYIHTTYVHIHT